MGWHHVAQLANGERDYAQMAALVARLFPGWSVEPTEGSSLVEGTHPEDGIAYAGAFAGVDVVCHQRLAMASRLPAHLVEAGRGLRLVAHTMHSGSDSFGLASWNDGELVRSLIVKHSKVTEDIGERFAFEAPFWAGEHPAGVVLGSPSERPDPLPFHPLDLGNEALREYHR